MPGFSPASCLLAQTRGPEVGEPSSVRLSTRAARPPGTVYSVPPEVANSAIAVCCA